MSDVPGPGQRLAAEALGTFVLVLLGVGAALMSGGDYVVTALGFGLAVLVMVAALGRVSGGHFNPAVSLAAALAGRLPWRDAVTYWLAQVSGGVLGGLVLWTLMHGFPGFDSRSGFGQNSFGELSPNGYAWWAALLIELVMTAVFAGVVLAVTDERQLHVGLAPVAIGLALAGIHLASMSATGTSVNPARSIGANLFAGPDAILQLWVFVLAPMLGGAAAGVLYPAVFGRPSEPPTAAPDDSPAATSSPTGWTAPEWSAPGPPREWGQPAPPSNDPPWRPPVGTFGALPPASESPGSADPPPADHGFPSPTEPYWSQQLPQEWEDPDEGEGRTQLRPGGDD